MSSSDAASSDSRPPSPVRQNGDLLGRDIVEVAALLLDFIVIVVEGPIRTSLGLFTVVLTIRGVVDVGAMKNNTFRPSIPTLQTLVIEVEPI